MKSFEEIAGIWLQSELFGKQYSYRKGLEKDVEHLIKYFGSRNCEEIKGMDVDKFIQYETEHVNPNTGKPFSKRLMKAHLSAGLNIYEYALENESPTLTPHPNCLGIVVAILNLSCLSYCRHLHLQLSRQL